MAGRAKKSTKKFEKNHLKDTIDKRKESSKVKQRQQIKAKKQARNAADHARVPDHDDEEPVANGGIAKDNATTDLSKMSVDKFFQSGFNLPELQKQKSKGKNGDMPPKIGKRKRDAEEVSDVYLFGEGVSAPSDEDMDSEQEDDLATHKGDLEALAEKDPEFYNYLKENDAELLDFDEEADLAEVDELSEEEAPKGKGAKKAILAEEQEDDQSEVSMDMVKKWKSAMSEQYSLRAMRQIVLAFRAAAYINSDDNKAHRYSIASPEVYHELLVTTLQHAPNVLNHHLPAKESSSGKIRMATDSRKYRTLTPLLKSHSTSIHHLLESLSDAPTIKLTLSSLLPLLPYLLSLKKFLRSLTKTTVSIWSDPSSTETVRITAFLLLRRLFTMSDPSLREAVLKTTYQGLVKGSRLTSTHTLPGINLMKNSAAELWSLDPSIGYTTGFSYIRQLAVHLRASITRPTKDSYKTIYNWQYTHSLDFWSRVLSLSCCPVQLTLGAARLIPTPTYFPLRFHLIRSLLRLSRTTNTYIPLAPPLLECLASPAMSKPPKASTLPPLDFSTTLRAPKSYTHTRTYQDGLGAEVQELLAEFFGAWAKNIAFPELIIPPTVTLKRWLKSSSNPSTHTPTKNRKQPAGNKNTKLHARFSLLLQKLTVNAAFVEAKRRDVTFGPGDRTQVDAFLGDVPMEETPLGAFVEGMRRVREEREGVLERGRREEERRREQGDERGGGRGGKVGRRGAGKKGVEMEMEEGEGAEEHEEVDHESE